jgi:hypothetical protein
VPAGVTGHRTQRPRGQAGPPGPHPAQPSSSPDPGGERRPISPPLAPLIAQLWSQGWTHSPGKYQQSTGGATRARGVLVHCGPL